MENEAVERLGLCVWRYSVMSRNGEWRMGNEAVERLGLCVWRNGEWGMGNGEWDPQFSFLLSSKTHSQQRTLFDGALGVEFVGF